MSSTEVLWARYEKYLRNFIQQKIKLKEDQEDILQEVFIKVIRGLKNLNEKEKVESWLFQITRNTIYDHYRKKGREEEVIEQWLKKPIQDQKSDDLSGFLSCLEPFIEELPLKDSEILKLEFSNSMNQKEIAESLNLPVSTAKSRIQRARQKLKNKFTQCCRDIEELKEKCSAESCG